jgi:hypothetical protein
MKHNNRNQNDSEIKRANFLLQNYFFAHASPFLILPAQLVIGGKDLNKHIVKSKSFQGREANCSLIDGNLASRTMNDIAHFSEI